MTDQEADTVASVGKIKRKQDHQKMDDLLRINKARHATERRMAWVSIFFMMGISLFVLFIAPPTAIEGYTGYLTAVLLSFSSIVAGYLGFSTWGANKLFSDNKLQQQGSDGSSSSESTTAG